MSSSSNRGSSGISFTGALQVAFIVLKLTHYIDWSWFWVLSPTIAFVAMVIFAVIVLVLAEVNT